MAKKGFKTHRPTNELYVRRLKVEEALLKLDHYLDYAIVSGLNQFTIVHGKGDGVLRHALQEQLTKYPLVQSYRDGLYGEGEAGVTVVYLT
jgi:DNA mismatch repair protein MutS2